jgi:heat-inducible transcriptional repressor
VLRFLVGLRPGLNSILVQDLTSFSTRATLVLKKTAMTEITERQRKLLLAIIERYIDTARPVGSETVEKEFALGVSPATLRNEMAVLEKAGFLKKPHASAGRVPTPTGLKFYINELMKEKALSIKEEVLLKERLWRDRFEFDKLMVEMTKTLAERTRGLAVAALEEGRVYHSGMANILDMPEFYDIDLTQAVLALLDKIDGFRQLFARGAGEGPTYILLGEELGVKLLKPCGMVFARFDAGRHRTGNLGVLGPMRLNYAEIIPLVRYFGELISEIAQGW